MRRSSESPRFYSNHTGRGRTQANVVPTSELQRRPAAGLLLPARATFSPSGFGNSNTQRSSRETPFRPAFRLRPRAQTRESETPNEPEANVMVANALLFTIAI